MVFSEAVIQEAWQRSGGVCECKRYEHNHANYRCSNNITFAHRGTESQGAWETHHIEKGSGDTLENCELLCCYCHKLLPEK